MIGRTHGKGQPSVVVLHGGPADFGGVAELCDRMSERSASYEPFLTGTTISRQVEQTVNAIRSSCKSPVVLIGHSWGAWIALLVASGHPALVRKLVLIGAGPLEPGYVADVDATRRLRFSSPQEEQVQRLFLSLCNDSLAPSEKRARLKALSELFMAIDNYDAVKESVVCKEPIKDCIFDIPKSYFADLMGELNLIRTSGELLGRVESVRCPIIVFHGDYDPHPWQGVVEPLERIGKDFQFHKLRMCGHTPWLEKRASTEFLGLLKRELY